MGASWHVDPRSRPRVPNEPIALRHLRSSRRRLEWIGTFDLRSGRRRAGYAQNAVSTAAERHRGDG